jgi:hypothetical protein
LISERGNWRKHGIKIKAQDLPSQVLLLLLARPGEIVTREPYLSNFGYAAPPEVGQILKVDVQ